MLAARLAIRMAIRMAGCLAPCLTSCLVVLLLAASPRPALALDAQVGECFCREALARILCKSPAELNYVGRQEENAMVFNVFYGSKNSNFVCTFFEEGGRGTVVITSKIWLRERRSLDFTLDRSTFCAASSIRNPSCPRKPISCCRTATPDEARQASADSFWYKPIPKELMNPASLGGVENSTAGGLTVRPPDPRQLFPAANATLPGDEPPAKNATAANATKPAPKKAAKPKKK
jgi:hypothetical protein